MWRSVVVARAAVSSRQGGAVWRRFYATQNPKHKVPASSSSKAQTQTESEFPVFSTNWGFPKRLFICQNPRFYSQTSTNTTDSEESSVGFVENGDTQLENSEIHGVSEQGFVGIDENRDTQLDSFIPRNWAEILGVSDQSGDAQFDSFATGEENGDEEEEVYEINVEQLENVLSLLQSSVDGSLESALDDMGLTLHEEFVVKVLETPLVLGENLIRFFKWGLKKKSEFKVTTCVVDALVRAISRELKKKDAYALWDLIKEIGEKENGVLNVEILNQLIALLSKLGKGKASLEVFNKFGDFGCVPNVDTYYFTIEALCRRSMFGWAWSVCEKMLDEGSVPENEKEGKIISWLCKGRKAKDAHSVYLFAKEKNQITPQSSVNFLISSLCREDETVKLALEMLDDFSGEARKYAIKPFSTVIHGLCRMKDVDGAKQLLSKMIAEGPPPGNAVFNSVISGYSKAGDLGEAIQIKKLMESRGLKPDVYTYTVIMSGYTNGGQMEEACKLLSEAKKKHSKLTPVTYHTLIRGYCKLEEFDKALKLLAEMKDFDVQPNVDEYNKLIQSLCLKALDWETAEKLLEEMKEKGLHLNGITKGLIRAVKEMEEEELVLGS
nr:pentatricopeptide repeat-containing protein At3g02650, mitochondrial-like [Quercus suber]POE73855.1 pentatricopeptide repeat-containing protein, mitochondrial [Quercus suber]